MESINHRVSAGCRSANLHTMQPKPPLATLPSIMHKAECYGSVRGCYCRTDAPLLTRRLLSPHRPRLSLISNQITARSGSNSLVAWTSLSISIGNH